MVAAPSGYGKTTLLGSWFSNSSYAGRVAWYTCDERDNDAGTFCNALNTMASGLEGTRGDCGEENNGYSRASLRERILPLLVNRFTSLDASVYLVLDEIQHLDSKKALKILAFLVAWTPPCVHFVLCGTHMPQIPTLGDVCSIIDSSVLAFTEEEIEGAASWYGLDIQSLFARTVRTITGGWPALLIPALLKQTASIGRNVHDILAAYVSPASLMEHCPDIRTYIRNTLLEPMDGAVRTALEIAAVPPYITDKLFNELSLIRQVLAFSTSRFTTLKALQEQYFLIQKISESHPVRYEINPLVRAVLNESFKENDSRGFKLAVRHSISFLEYIGEKKDAVLLASEHNFPRLAASIIDHGMDSLMAEGELGFILTCTASLPQDILERYPQLKVIAALVLLLEGARIEEVRKALPGQHGIDQLSKDIKTIASALENLETDGKKGLSIVAQDHSIHSPQDFTGKAIDVLLIIRNLAGGCNIPELITHTRKMMAGRDIRQGDIFPLVLMTLSGFLHLDQLDISSARTCFHAAGNLSSQKKGDAPLHSAPTFIGQAAASLLEHRPEDAAVLTGYALNIAGDRDVTSTVAGLCVRLSSIICAGGTAEEISTVLDSLFHYTPRLPFPHIGARIQEYCTAQAALAQGHVAIAGSWADSRSRLHPEEELYVMWERECILASDIRHAQEMYEDAGFLASAVWENAAARGRKSAELEGLCCLAAARFSAGDKQGAIVSIESALELTARSGCSYSILSRMEKLEDILRTVAETGRNCLAARKLLGTTDTLSGNPVDDDSFSLSSSMFSRKEMDILKALADGRMNKEIAADMHITLRTVKWHVGNIMRKLGASSRTEAVVMAHKQGLV